MNLNVLYLAHDLSDAAVRRRVVTLQAGGARVTVAGFQRKDNLLQGEAEVRSILLGRTADGRLGQRIAAVLKARLSLGRLLRGIEKPDVIIARNLEMLALSKGASSFFGGVPVVYECLDIHRLLLDDGIKGRLLRGAEASFGRGASLLITSSPAFIEHYFNTRSGLHLPTLLLENKVLELQSPAGEGKPRLRPPAPGEPWRIGWFGAIRCAKSFRILAEFAARMEGRVEIIIRGRPSPREFADFNSLVAASPHVRFHGAYKNPEDLAEIYREVQFVWAIDFFEEGLNSSWLLPNRLYEGSLHGAIPIALQSTETGRYLGSRSLGLLMERANPEELHAHFSAMNADAYTDLFESLARVDRAHWVTGPSDCVALVRQLSLLGVRDAAQPDLTLTSTLQSEG
ncbi:glycosyltransferase [Rhizobium oryzicola]|uniref:Glycosyl transferase family 1 n=1 Tax=Rhizobium oryzicola TaxID=1232668 RepID=A0ABT8T1B1_9HYPH|nr:glycosyltransferase [Rhizobium oryzicola]MDO1584179.1 glycosyl transferase family 1 [Rhizobium oryzicola]